MFRVSITDEQTDFPIDRGWFRDVCRFVGERLKVGAELGIAFVRAERMLELNTRHLGHDYVTDILTFPAGAPPGKLAGELAICPAYGKEMAEEYGLAVHEELTLYVIHGMLHLAGYDDKKPGPKAEMEKLQETLLREFLARSADPSSRAASAAGARTASSKRAGAGTGAGKGRPGKPTADRQAGSRKSSSGGAKAGSPSGSKRGPEVRVNGGSTKGAVVGSNRGSDPGSRKHAGGPRTKSRSGAGPAGAKRVKSARPRRPGGKPARPEGTNDS